MSSILDDLAGRLAELEAAGLRRRLDTDDTSRSDHGLDFVTNDYLSLSRHPALGRLLTDRLALLAEGGGPVGAPASRLLRGDSPLHRRIEARLARFKGCEAALLFPSGYQANVGLLSALIGAGDRVVSDEANHASLIDGIRLARCAKVIVPHLDVGALEETLRTPFPGRTFVVTESLYSMDGDLAPLADYARLCEQHGAALIVDDAHATGLYGERGSGWVEAQGVARRLLAVTSTFGKALGLGGAWVAGSRVLIDYLTNRCRSFVFSTAVSPLMLLAFETALDVAEAEPRRRRRVLDAAERLRLRLRRAGLDCRGRGGPIVPVVLGEVGRAMSVAAALRDEGFDVLAVRPPTVPEGTARLRLSIHADHTDADLDRLARRLIALAEPDASREQISEVEQVLEVSV